MRGHNHVGRPKYYRVWSNQWGSKYQCTKCSICYVQHSRRWMAHIFDPMMVSSFDMYRKRLMDDVCSRNILLELLKKKGAVK